MQARRVRRAEEKQQPADDTLPTPARGWGNGVADDWMGKSTLRFNGAAQRQFGSLRLAAGEPLLLVFGGASVSDMLRNWAIHVQKLSLPFAVACMDVALFELADGHGLPGVMMAEGALKEDGATMQQSSVTTRWKYFRMDPKAFMTMGILKVKFFMEFCAAASTCSAPTSTCSGSATQGRGCSARRRRGRRGCSPSPTSSSRPT